MQQKLTWKTNNDLLSLYIYIFFVAINPFFYSSYSVPIGYLFIVVIVLFTFVNVYSVNIMSIVLGMMSTFKIWNSWCELMMYNNHKCMRIMLSFLLINTVNNLSLKLISLLT